MEIKKTSEKHNPLLGRTDISFTIDHPSSGTPKLLETRTALASMLKISQDRVYIVKMKTPTGSNQTIGEAEIYDEADRAKSAVPEYIQTRNNPPQEKSEKAPQPTEKGKSTEKSEKQ